MLARQHLYPARVVQFPAGYAFSLSTFHAELQVGERNRWRNPYETLSDKANSYWQQNINVLRRLSVVGSVAPPGTAWGAEGLRGNEANENKLMVLAGVRPRKCQSGPVLHKRTSPVVSAWLSAAMSELPKPNERHARHYAPLETSRAHCWACQ